MQQTILATDLDGTFLGGNASERAALYDWIGQRRSEIVLIYVTGRSLTTMRDVLDELPLQPDHIISDVGTAVYAGAERTPLPALERWLDEGWPQHTPAAVRGILARHPHLTEQPVVEGRRVSCFYSDAQLAGAARTELQAAGYDVLLSAERYFDVLPLGVQKGPLHRNGIPYGHPASHELRVTADVRAGVRGHRDRRSAHRPRLLRLRRGAKPQGPRTAGRVKGGSIAHHR